HDGIRRSLAALSHDWYLWVNCFLSSAKTPRNWNSPSSRGHATPGAEYGRVPGSAARGCRRPSWYPSQCCPGALYANDGIRRQAHRSGSNGTFMLNSERGRGGGLLHSGPPRFAARPREDAAIGIVLLRVRPPAVPFQITILNRPLG